MNLLNIYRETICDGEGIRYSLYLAGCAHQCPGCHNPESWDPAAGIPLTDEHLNEIINEINSNLLLDGVTLSGGDPFYHPEELLTLVKKIKECTHLNLWCYTGYTIEMLQADPRRAEVLKYIDVLVDGPFEQNLRDVTLRFRGSTNQRIIHLKDGQATNLE